MYNQGGQKIENDLVLWEAKRGPGEGEILTESGCKYRTQYGHVHLCNEDIACCSASNCGNCNGELFDYLSFCIFSSILALFLMHPILFPESVKWISAV